MNKVFAAGGDGPGQETLQVLTHTLTRPTQPPIPSEQLAGAVRVIAEYLWAGGDGFGH